MRSEKSAARPRPATGADSVPLGVLLIMGSLSALAPLSFDMYLPALPELERDFGVSEAAVQFTLSACLIGVATGQLFGGPLSDALGRRRPLMVGISAYIAMSFLCVVAPSVGFLTVVRFLQGFSGGIGIVIARAMVRDKTEGTEAARLFSRLVLVSGSAPILAPIIGGQLDRFTSWRGIFVVLALIGVALLAAIILHLPESLPVERRRTGGMRDTISVFRRISRDRVFLGYAFGGGFSFGAMFLYISSSSFVLQDIYDMSSQQFSAIFAMNAIGLMAMGRLNAYLLRRRTPQQILPFGMGLLFLASYSLMAVVALDLGLPFLLPLLLLVVASNGLNTPNATALALAPYGREAGSVAAQLGVTQFLLGAIAGAVIGMVGEVTDMSMSIGIAIMATLAVSCYLGLVGARPWRREHRALQPAG